MSSFCCNVVVYVRGDDLGVYIEKASRPHSLLIAAEHTSPRRVFRRPLYFLRQTHCARCRIRLKLPRRLSYKRRAAIMRGLVWFIRQLEKHP